MVLATTFPAKGLFGEVFYSDTGLNALSDALALMEGDADGTFVSSRIQYGEASNRGYDPVTNMLAHDAESLSDDADPAQSFEMAAIRLTGSVWLEAGSHTFYSTTDDGFRLLIDGQETAIFENTRGAQTTEGVFEAETAGWYDIQVDYFDNRGRSVLEIEHAFDGGPRQVLDDSRMRYEDPNLTPVKEGLFGEVFYSDTGLNALSDALALMEGDADGTFVSSRIQYGEASNRGYDPVTNMLAHDAESLSDDADPAQSFDMAAIRLTGSVWLEAGSHSFYNTTDDGFRLLIDGQETAIFENTRGAGTTEGVFEAETAGWYDIQVDYFDNRGRSVLEIEHAFDGGPRQILDNSRLRHQEPQDKDKDTDDIKDDPADGVVTPPHVVSETAKVGLFGEVFYSDTGLNALSDALALMEGDADGTFVSSRIQYGEASNRGYDPVTNMLAHDAESLSDDADPAQSFDMAAIRLTGSVWLEAGSHSFYNTTDDGFRLLIDGQETAIFENTRGAQTTEGVFEAETAGWYDIQVDYFDNKGRSVLEIEHAFDGGPRQILDNSRLMYQPPEDGDSGDTETAVNAAPVAFDDALVAVSGQKIAVDTAALLGNDIDGDGDILSIVGVRALEGGNVTFEDGKVFFLAAAGFEGMARLEYTVSDGQATDIGQVSVEVEAPAPTYAQNLLAQVAENAGEGLADPSLAVGLDSFSYWKSPPFLNLMKQANFPGIRDAEGNRIELATLVAEGYLDANGYPIRIPEENDQLPDWQQGYNILVSIHHQNDFIRKETSGEFVVEWKGEGEIGLVGFDVTSREVLTDDNGNVLGGRMTGVWGYEDQLKMVKITDTDPAGTGNYIRDISIVRAEYKDMYDVGAIFDPRYLELIEDHHTIRYMDWMKTNGSDVETLDDVASLDTLTWAGSVDITDGPKIDGGSGIPLGSQIPFEVMVQMANEIGADPWFNIPLEADDAYVKALAQYVEANLDDGLVAKFELSNEIWNWGFFFEQVKEASLLGSDGQNDGSLREAREYYGYRSAEIREILNAEMGRVDAELVLGTQTAYFWVTQLVEAGVQEYFSDQGRDGQMSDVFDAIAVTGYFEGLNNNAMADLRQHWHAESEALFAAGDMPTKHQFFVERAADYLANGLDALSAEELALVERDANGGFRNDITNPLEGFLRDNFAANKRMADAWGLELIQYEGDSHITPKNYSSDPESEWYKALNTSPEMGELLALAWKIFREEGGTLVNDFGHLGDTNFGLWGTRAHLADENPIAAAYDAYNASAAADYGSLNEGRDADAFLQGITVQGTAAAEILLGTEQRDYLLGGAGADLLVGGNSTDGLNGGDGVDIALFWGSSDSFDFRFDDDGLLYVNDGTSEDRLANVEILAFAGSRDFVSVAELGDAPDKTPLADLLAAFDAENPILDDFFSL